MKQKRIIAILLLICLCIQLVACHNQTEDPSLPSEPDGTTGTTESTGSAPDQQNHYRDARKAAEKLFNYQLTFDYSLRYQVNGNDYRETSIGTALYSGRGNALQAFVSENLTFGSYETQYYRSYMNGVGYCRVENYNFSCQLSDNDFMAQVIPSVLLNENNYNTVTTESIQEGTLYSFSDAIRLENWAGGSDHLELTTAYGTAKLSESNELTESSYHAEYIYGGIPHTLDVTVTIDSKTTPDFTGQPIYGEDCPTLTDLRIPRLLIQAVGAIFETRDMTATYTDTLYSEAFAMIRTQQGSCDIYGSGKDLAAQVSTHVSVTDYTGTAVSNTQDVTFANGVYSYATNGGEPVTDHAVTSEDMRIYCEDTILSSLFSLESIGAATLTQTDDFIYIEFEGNTEYSNSICTGIYDIFGFNLDNYATSHETTASGGYLALNRYTRLPTATGMSLERIHYISGVPYRLTYQLDQAMQLPSTSAYETLTGNTPAEKAPAQIATPLFYKVTGPEGQQLWLLGTIHVGDEHTNFLPDAIMTAFNESNALAVEFDSFAFNEMLLSDAGLQQDFSNAYYYNDRTTVHGHLDEAAAKELDIMMRLTGNYNINAPYVKVSIWCSLIENFYLAQGASLSADKGMDSRLLGWAKEQDKPIYEIESGLSQLQMLTGFSDELQQQQLVELLDSGLIDYCTEVEELYSLWCAGDEAALTAYLATDTTDMTEEELELWDEYNKAMIKDRNKAMAKTAKQYLESGETVFYAVGLAHLLGEGSIIERLQDAGYTVELVTYE